MQAGVHRNPALAATVALGNLTLEDADPAAPGHGVDLHVGEHALRSR